jgi:hypothetical protein
VARGQTADIGTERVSPNGYRYRKTGDGWETVHRLLAEENLGRRLANNEYATFKDGDKTNLDPENIIVRLRGRTSLRRRHALVESRISELTAERDMLEKRLEVQQTLGVEDADL